MADDQQDNLSEVNLEGGEQAADHLNEDELIVTIGDEESTTSEDEQEQQNAPQWAKDLRKRYDETAKENRRLSKELEAKAKVEPVEVTLGEKPTLESCDFDAEQFEADLDAWKERKHLHDTQQQAQQQSIQQQEQAYKTKLTAYEKAKTELKVSDYDEVEKVVRSTLNEMQQGLIIQHIENPAVLAYALGKNTKALDNLASIKDPVEYLVKLIRLENKLKVETRKAPAPETKVNGKTATGGSADKTLEKLREEAAKTGDMSKVTAYKRQLRAA